MNVTPNKTSLILSACVLALALGGCGGGSSARPEPIGAAPPPLPPAPPPPAPLPPPPPPPITSSAINYNDAEYSRSNGANSGGAIIAYNAGGTGQGVKIAVIDSGINPNLPEFAGKIDPASRDMVANRGISDIEGHGTAVSAVAAAARDGAGMMGVAFGSTIISLNTSNTGDCDAKDGCQHKDSAIAAAIDVARNNGARVINISLGGDGVSTAALSAVHRATSAGIVVVISAGNERKADPTVFALRNASESGNGSLIIAGSHNADRSLSDFSNKAGAGSVHYLAALGERVLTVDHTGAAFFYSGTSFSAPVISGAAALLASAFPHLSGGQIVDILLKSADDAGAAGRDAMFGNGILNIARAFQPLGQTSIAGSGVAVSTTNNGETSGAMGDLGGQSVGAIILDGYSRAYAVDLARTLSRAPQERPLAQALQGNTRTAGATAGATSVSITMRRNLSGLPQVGLAQTGMDYEDSRQARVLAGHALSRLTPATAVAFGFSESGRTLQQRLSSQSGNAFLIARDPLARAGFNADSGTSIGVRHDLGPVALTVTSERGRVQQPGLRRGIGAPSYDINAVTADRRFGRAGFSLGASRLSEQNTVLGGHFAFGGVGASSYFLDSAASYDFGSGWGVDASYRRGLTVLPGGGVATGGRLSTDAFAFDVSKRGAFARGDRLAFRIMQPLRVRSGGYDLQLPVSYDYSDGSVGYEMRRFNLAPTGRELDFEAAYSLALLDGRGDFGANLFLRREPGHVETMRSDVGGALRFTLGF